jgi:hypothetical protein
LPPSLPASPFARHPPPAPPSAPVSPTPISG